MRRQFLKSAAAVAAGLATASFSTAAMAQDAAAFYEGNAINFVVPYNPGGGYDEYARLIAPYLEKYTGARIDILNVPGSGGMKGAVEIFNSPNDGTYIGIINGSAMVTNQLAEIEGANYRVGDYEYLGRIVADPRVLTMAANSGMDTFETIQSDGETAVIGATGLGGSTYVDAVIIGEAFGMDQRVIPGFDRSGDIRTAMLRGDVDGMWGSLGSALSGIRSGDQIAVLHGERDTTIEELAGVPSIWERAAESSDPARAEEILTAWVALSAVGRPVAAPPGVPADRLAFLQDAFEQAINDPEFVAAAQGADRDLSPLNGADMSVIAKEATELSPEIEALFVKAIKGEL